MKISIFLIISFLCIGILGANAQVPIETLNKGVEYFNQQDYDKAIEIFSKAINENETVPGKVYFYRAFSYSKTNQYENAINDFNAFLNFEPEDYKSHFYKGACLYELKNYKEAEESFLKAIEIKPDFIKAIWQLGSTYEQLNNNAEALKAFNKAIALDSTNIDYYFKRANFFIYRVGDDDKAAQDLFKILQIDSSYKPEIVLPQFINILVKQKYYSQANKFSNILININEDNPIGYYFRGITNLLMGEEGCNDLKIAYEKGYEDAKEYIDEFCN